MRDSLLKMFGSVKLVQEISRTNQTRTSSAFKRSEEASTESSVPVVPRSSDPVPNITTLHHVTTATPTNMTVTATSAPVMKTLAVPLTINSPCLAQTTRHSFSSLKHSTRKSTKYSLRHYRPRQPSFTYPPSVATTTTNTTTKSTLSPNPAPGNSEKSKSQKLLCLWPLPITTRYVICLSILISTLNYFNWLHLSCSSPSLVFHRFEVFNLLLSPFLFNWSLHSILFFGWNVLILGLFEESLTHMLGGTRRFVQTFTGVIFAVCTLRQIIGYVFWKSTGWAVPVLFFSDSVHECNQGLAPFLFALLVVQSLSIDDKYMLIYGMEDSNHKLTVRKVTLQLLMLLVNFAVKNIFWWSLSGILTGGLVTLMVQVGLTRQKREEVPDVKDVNELLTLERYRRMPLWRILWSAVKKGSVVLLLTLPVLMLCNMYYTQQTFVEPSALNAISDDRYMFTFIVMTAPRRGNPPFLSQTLESYLANWPVDPPAGSLYSRIQTIVYTHFTHHEQFDMARDRFANDPKGQQYLKWVREEGSQMNQRLHVSKALNLVTDNFPSTYVTLVEDDFPVCGSKEWKQIETVVYNANQRVPDHCGVFVGTGGR
ncbi:uncharacterized protein BYT42DRAFT_579315 [Radiomyces spectabilis]|uniref:uncharacterized protein n=1 Tax=Radiomyces spectabilis TaxID=64574 RepID=UPI00221ED0CC|nr:uncharacterized protein BYT42DRAFT_579315 [Radiomyces spectabilis]KAI8373138.1 hypothetical protein BYT42DRAFT_579315 [Radiomyces spectabilis]